MHLVDRSIDRAKFWVPQFPLKSLLKSRVQYFSEKVKNRDKSRSTKIIPVPEVFSKMPSLASIVSILLSKILFCAESKSYLSWRLATSSSVMFNLSAVSSFALSKVSNRLFCSTLSILSRVKSDLMISSVAFRSFRASSISSKISSQIAQVTSQFSNVPDF